MCVLIVTGSPHQRRTLAAGFRDAGYAVEAVEDVEEAVVSSTRRSHRVVLIDVELRGSCSMDVLRRLRREGSEARILMLTPPDSIEHRVQGLNSGADDCLQKPCSFEELLARVRVLLREPRQPSSRVRVGDLVVDPDGRRVTRNGLAIQLTAREFRVLERLALSPGEPVPHAELEEHVYGPGRYPMSNSIASTVCLLRKKLGVTEGVPLVRTRRGQGYYLSPAEGS